MTAQQTLRGDVAVLVPAAGLGTRLGPGAPKALRELAGVSLLSHAVRRVARAPSVGCVVVAAPPGEAVSVREMLDAEVLRVEASGVEAPTPVRLIVIEGGSSRQESVGRALAAAPPSFPIILVHDAARALAPPDLVERVAAAVRGGHDAVIPVLPVVDTIKQVDESDAVIGTVDRSVLRAVQTPQGFRREVLAAAHASAVDQLTDDAGLAEKIGVRVHCVPGAETALKITRPFDLAVAALLLDAERSIP